MSSRQHHRPTAAFPARVRWHTGCYVMPCGLTHGVGCSLGCGSRESFTVPREPGLLCPLGALLCGMSSIEKQRDRDRER
jgi:hypothetical protein